MPCETAVASGEAVLLMNTDDTVWFVSVMIPRGTAVNAGVQVVLAVGVIVVDEADVEATVGDTLNITTGAMLVTATGDNDAVVSSDAGSGGIAAISGSTTRRSSFACAMTILIARLAWRASTGDPAAHPPMRPDLTPRHRLRARVRGGALGYNRRPP